MKDEIIARLSPHPAGRVRLTGRVAGVQACELVADRDNLLIGSSLACDLTVADPLLPARAFRLKRRKCHAGTERNCQCQWTLEALPGARVYVNRQLTHHEQLRFGDLIASGCHEYEFAMAGDIPRNERSNRNVSDLCAALTRDHAIPPGFLGSTPTALYRQRRNKAVIGTFLFLLAVSLVVLLAPRREYFEPVQPPLDVFMSDVVAVPSDAVRSLEQVARKVFDSPVPAVDQAVMNQTTMTTDAVATEPLAPTQPKDVQAPALPAVAPVNLAALDPAAVASEPSDKPSREPEPLTASAAPARRIAGEPGPDSESVTLAAYEANLDRLQPEVQTVPRENTPPAPLPLPPARPDSSPAWKLPAMRPDGLNSEPITRPRSAASLTASAPSRRLSVAEARQPTMAKADLGTSRTAIPAPAQEAVARPVERDVAAGLSTPAAGQVLAATGAKNLDSVSRFQPSPVAFEGLMGTQVPVARVAEELSQMDVKTDSASPLKVDGEVSGPEMDASWKSGRFRRHAPGNPPPEADPPTYCYVGKTELNGKPCLYISFVCMDPDLNALIADSRNTDYNLIMNDSVEVFLDVNFDHKDYHQILVDARGVSWTAYFSAPYNFGTVTPQAWNAIQTIKTTINREAGQWVCELMIPFDRLGGVPAPGSRWGVNMCRNFRGQKQDWQLQSWFSVYEKERNFHNPKFFGIFQW